MVATTMTAAYTAHVTRGERFWVVHVPDVEHYTQARNLGEAEAMAVDLIATLLKNCLLYTSPSPRDRQKSRMPSSA